MTAHTPRIFTEGETALFEAFESAKFAADVVPHKARTAAIEALKANGLPTKRVEAYHYTDLRALLRGAFTVAERPSKGAAEQAGSAFPRLVDGAAVLHFRDGHFFDMGEAMPDGVSFQPMQIGDEVATDTANALEQISTAFANSAVLLTVAENTTVDQTIGLASTPTGETIGAHRVSVRVGAGSKCRLIERSVGRDDSAYCQSSIVDLDVADGAEVSYILSLEDGDAATRLGRLNVRIGKDAQFNLFVANLGGRVARQELNFDMAGENAQLDIAGFNLIGGDAHLDITSRITHHVPHCNATELFRNVATGKGSGVFQGQINVAQPAQKTDARMACNTLLLSDQAEFSAKPELEIFADDVQCGHGATLADIENTYMFYLQARGISEKRARELLVRAFVAEVIENLEDEALVERLEARMDVWMERHV